MFTRKKEGSITLEASLILPIFLGFVLLLIAFIQITMVQIALEHSVTEATKQVATHMYPIDIMYGEASETNVGSKVNDGIGKLEDGRKKILDLEQMLNNEYSQLLPEEYKAIFSARQAFENKASDAYNSALGTAFQPIVKYYADEKLLDSSKIQVTKVKLPDLRSRDDLYFGMEIQYEMPLNVPFFNKTVTLKESAYERVWIGSGSQNKLNLPSDSSSNTNPEASPTDKENKDEKNQDQEEEIPELKITSVTPVIQRYYYVTITAVGPPNESGTFRIYYPSGHQKSETFKFDSTGYVKSKIRIGPNSNPGTFRVVAISGSQSDEATFEVRTKDQMDELLKNRNSNKK